MNDEELVNSIRKNVEMGIDGIKMVIQYAKDEKFVDALNSQLNEYQNIYAEADELLKKIGGTPKDVPAMAKISAEFMSSIRCMSAGEDAKIAEDMVRGNTSGFTKLTRQLHEYPGCNKEVIDFANRVIHTEESNCEQMKQFL